METLKHVINGKNVYKWTCALFGMLLAIFSVCVNRKKYIILCQKGDLGGIYPLA